MAVRLGELAGVSWDGSYTLLVMPTNSASITPAGDEAGHPTNSPAGFGASKVTSRLGSAIQVNIVVDTKGKNIHTLKLSPERTLQLSGHLADGAILTHSSGISDEGWWPLYVSLYGDQGFLIGWINLATNDPARPLVWLKPAKPKNKFYPAGFSVQRPVLLSAFEPTLSTASLDTSLNWTKGILVVGGGNLPEVLTNRVAVTFRETVTQSGAVTVNRVTLSSPLTGSVTNNPLTNLSLTLDLLTPSFSGSFTHPATHRRTFFRGGRVDQPSYAETIPVWGGGWFLGTNQGGFVRLEPDFVPDSLTGLTAHLSISSDPAWATITFFTNGFTQTGATSGAGTNLHTKLSTTASQLTLDWTAPPELSNRMDQIVFTFTSPFDGSFTFTNVNPDTSQSAASGTFWLESPGDSAPASLEGHVISAVIPGLSPLVAVFGASTYTQTGPGEGAFAVGNYTYEKQSPTFARLTTVATAPPASAGQTNQIDLRFARSGMGFYTNNAGVGGYTNIVSTSFTLKSQTNIAPAAIATKTIEFTYPKQAGVSRKVLATNAFDSAVFTQSGFESGSGDYSYQMLSPNGALLILGRTAPLEAAGNTNHLVLTFTTSAKGTFSDNLQIAGGANGFRTGTFRLR